MINIPDFTEFKHKGYTLKQFNNIWHYQIINADGKTVLTVACTQKLTEQEAVEKIDNFISQQKGRNKVKACPVCNKEFKSPKGHYTYCSEDCRKRGKAIRDKMKRKKKQFAKRQEKALRKAQEKAEPKYNIKNCKCCGKPFNATNQNRVYCSSGCKIKAKYKQQEVYHAKRDKKKGKRHYNDALCWHCQKACGGCSWSRSLIPVDGWEAKEVDLVTYEGLKSYKVIECPEFVEGR